MKGQMVKIGLFPFKIICPVLHIQDKEVFLRQSLVNIISFFFSFMVGKSYEFDINES